MAIAAPSRADLYMLLRSVVSLCVLLLVATVYALSFENAKNLVRWDAGACPARAGASAKAQAGVPAPDALAFILDEIRDAMNDPRTTGEVYARLTALRDAAVASGSAVRDYASNKVDTFVTSVK